MPTFLNKVGYRSYHSGKWHIDGEPMANGFNHSYYLKDQHRFFNPQKHSEDGIPLPAVQKDSGFYGTIAVTNKMIQYLKEHQKNHQGKPFFGYLAYAAPHFPLHALPEDIKKVGDRYRVGWDVIRQKRWQNLKELNLIKGELSEVLTELGPPYYFPESLKALGSGEVNRPIAWRQLTKEQQVFQQAKMTIHAAMIERMDSEIGRILEQVSKMNALKDTLVLFFSDNGASAEIMVRADGHDPKADLGSAESHLCLGPGWATVSNTPFKKHKTWNHEGGISTPFIAHWPNGISGKGEYRSTPAHVIDLVPTILDLVGSIPQTKVSFPGQSILQSFQQDSKTSRTLWWCHDDHQAIRVGDWKLVKSVNENWELYNLADDRTEVKNLANMYPEKVAALKKAWKSQVDDFRKDISIK